MKPATPQLAFYDVPRKGSIHLWRYLDINRAFPRGNEYHMTADDDGVSYLVALISALMNSPFPCHRTIPVSRPSDAILRGVNNLGGTARIASEHALRIAFDPLDSSEEVFVDSYSGGVLLRIGVRSAANLRSEIAGISEGDFDYDIGAIGGRLIRVWRFCSST